MLTIPQKLDQTNARFKDFERIPDSNPPMPLTSKDIANTVTISSIIQSSLSEFKITEFQIYVKPLFSCDGVLMTNTIRGNRHKLLIEVLIEKRKSANFTQHDLADKLQVYQSHVARLESGQRRVDVIELLELANILNFDASELLKTLEKLPD